MLTRLRIAHFKCFADIEIQLDSPVVLVGGNGAGKTAALQALALWELGLRTFHARRAPHEPGRGHRAARSPRPLGVSLQRRDLTQIPLPSANHLWHRTEVRAGRPSSGERAQPLRMELAVDGHSGGERWSCGLELDYNNDDSLYCRPLRLPGFRESKVHGAKFSAIAEAATAVRVAYLPPMAGVAVSEPKWERGRVNVLLGEGQTAQVIRNLCLHLYTQKPDRGHWQRLCQRMQALFGVRLHNPEFIAERGEIVMKYREPDGTRLDLSAAGQGMLQTLLLLCHLYMNPGAVLLLDEPDAHLSPLRQRQLVRALLSIAAEQDSQVIAASHSEVVISEIAGRGSVVRLDGAAGRAQVMAALPAGMPGPARAAGWSEHLQAAAVGWVLYLPEPLDLLGLHALAQRLGHPAQAALEQPLCHYIGDGPEAAERARRHFHALRELCPALRGIALYSQPGPGPDRASSPAAGSALAAAAPDPVVEAATLPLPGFAWEPGRAAPSPRPAGPVAAAPSRQEAPAGRRTRASRRAGSAESPASEDGAAQGAAPAPLEPETAALYEHTWQRGDLDSYYALDEVLLAFAHHERGVPGDAAAAGADAGGPPRRQLQLVAMLSPEQRRREGAMRAAVSEIEAALRTLGRVDRHGVPSRTRADFLRPVLRRFAEQLGPAAALRESDYATLIRLAPPERLDREITHQLDAIAQLTPAPRPAEPPAVAAQELSLPLRAPVPLPAAGAAVARPGRAPAPPVNSAWPAAAETPLVAPAPAPPRRRERGSTSLLPIENADPSPKVPL
jgi:energy-coupling factor transporter ATP-binding protein EcfA2